MDSQIEEDGKCQEDKEEQLPNQTGDLPKALDEEVAENLSAVPVDAHHLQGQCLETQPKLLRSSDKETTKIAPSIAEDDRHLQRDHVRAEAEPLMIISDPSTVIGLEDQPHQVEQESATDVGDTHSETVTPAQDTEPALEVANGTTFVDPTQFWSEDQDAVERELVPDVRLHPSSNPNVSVLVDLTSMLFTGTRQRLRFGQRYVSSLVST